MDISSITENNRALVSGYITAVGQKQFNRLSEYLADDLEFSGPKSSLHSGPQYIKVLEKLGTILLHNDIKRIFVEGNEACVIYDFVTDTEVGIVPSVEWLKISQGKISSIHLIFDRYRWEEVIEVMNRRVKKN